MKKTLALILAIVMVVAALAGCQTTPATTTGTQQASSASSQASSAAPASTASAKDLKAEITVWCYPNYEGYETLVGGDVTTGLNKTYPNIKVVCELQSWDTGPEKVTVAYASGATPDILHDGISRVMPGIVKNLCVPVDDILAKYKDKMYPSFQAPVVYEGKNYYIPMFGSNGYNIAINYKLAKKLGVYDLLPADKIHWSYDQFLAFCRACRTKGKAENIYASQLWAGSRSSDSAYYSFIMSTGASILNKDHTKCVANDPKAAKALDLLYTLVKEDLVPAGAATTKDEDCQAPFDSGKTVMSLQSAGAQSEVYTIKQIGLGVLKRENIDLEIYMFPTPDGKADPAAMNWGASGFSIFKNKNDANKIAACKAYAEEILSKNDYIATACKNLGAVPVLKDVSIDFGDEFVNQQFKLANDWSANLTTSDMGILEPYWTQIREQFFPEMQALYTGKKTSQQALDSFAKNVDAILAKENKK